MAMEKPCKSLIDRWFSQQFNWYTNNYIYMYLYIYIYINTLYIHIYIHTPVRLWIATFGYHSEELHGRLCTWNDSRLWNPNDYLILFTKHTHSVLQINSNTWLTGEIKISKTIFGIIHLTNPHLWWGRREVVISFPQWLPHPRIRFLVSRDSTISPARPVSTRCHEIKPKDLRSCPIIKALW